MYQLKIFKPVHTMQIDIPAHIEKLLFLHDALVIPGFGGFTAMRTPASTDYVGGTVNPPAKTLSFSENLTIDDGLLTADIADAHGLSTEDASRTVEEFIEKMRNLLDQREIVTLPGVGRLYKNYVQKIQFLPDATNFNASSYGLPPLQFSPIARSREVEQAQASHSPTDAGSAVYTNAQAYIPNTPPPPMPEPTYAPERSGGSSSIGTVLGIFLLLAALSAGLWYWQHRKNAAETALKPDTEAVDTDRSAPEDKSVPETPTKEETVAPSNPDPNKAAQESLEAKEKAAREKVNIARNGRECILIIASLSDKSNAEKLRKLLTEENYQEFYEQKGKTHVVGIRFYYLKPAEIEAKKNALKALTGVNYIAVRKK
ncbi:MAG: hypothetical protein Q7T20_19460 [Saprospiraceae bacterium]|nr:hypothetical protein [Saprospiraceae bacterium]